jgi:undecaprenol kinase
MTKVIKSFGWAMNGLRTVWREEKNFKIGVMFAVIVIIAACIVGFPEWKWILLILIIGWVLMGEIVNTAVEDICNKIEPNQDPVIGKIKDTMAGYVLVSIVSAAIAGVILFLA